MRARDVVHVPRHADDATPRRRPTRPTASSSRCTSARAARTTRRRRSQPTLTSQLGAFARGLAEPAPAGVQPHALHRLERLGDAAQGRAPARHPLRHELLLHGPAGLDGRERPGPDDRLRLPAALRRPRRLDDRRLPGDDAGHRRGRGHAAARPPRCTRCSTARSTTRSAPRATTASSPRSCTRDLGDHTQLNDMVSEARDRGVPVVSSAQMLDWLDGRNGSSFGNIALQRRPAARSRCVTNDKARGLEAMLPAQLGHRPAGAAHARRRSRCRGAAAPSRASTTSCSRAPPAPTTATLRGRHVARRTITQVTATRRRRGPRDGDVDDRRAVDARASSTAARRRSATRSSATAPVTRAQHRAHRPRPGTTYSLPRHLRRRGRQQPRQSARSATFTTPRRRAGRQPHAPSSRAGHAAASTYAGGSARRHRRRGAAPARRSARSSTGLGLPAGWTSQPLGRRRHAPPRASARSTPTAPSPYAADVLRRRRATLEFSATFRPVNNQGVGFSNDFSDYPFAAFTTGDGGDAVRRLRLQRRRPAHRRATRRFPASTLNAPHRFRIEWRATSVEFFVDGDARGDAHRSRSTQRDAPDRQRLRPLRRRRARALAAPGLLRDDRHVHLARRSTAAPAPSVWSTLTATADLPDRHGDHVPDAHRRHPRRRTRTWSAWQNVGAGGAIASPAARFIQYRATLTGDGVARPRRSQRVLDRLQRRHQRARRVPGTVVAGARPRRRTEPDA